METPQECHTTSKNNKKKKNVFELHKVLQIRILWFCDALLFIDCAYHFRKSNCPKSQRVTVTQHILTFLTQSILLILLGWQVCNNSMMSFWNFWCIACLSLSPASALLIVRSWWEMPCDVSGTRRRRVSRCSSRSFQRSSTTSIAKRCQNLCQSLELSSCSWL